MVVLVVAVALALALALALAHALALALALACRIPAPPGIQGGTGILDGSWCQYAAAAGCILIWLRVLCLHFVSGACSWRVGGVSGARR